MTTADPSSVQRRLAALLSADVKGYSRLMGEDEVRRDVLEEIDGPMLQHGLQGFQDGRIHVPRADHLKPSRDFLAERYALFQRAG